MYGPSIREYYEGLIEQTQEAIRRRPDPDVVGVDPESLADYFISRCFPAKIELVDGKVPTIEQHRQALPNRHPGCGIVEVTKVRLSIFVHHEEHTAELMRRTASTFNFGMPRYEYHSGVISVLSDAEEFELGQALQLIKDAIEYKNQDVEAFTNEARRRLVEFVRARRSRLEHDSARMAALAERLPVELLAKAPAPSFGAPAPKVRRQFHALVEPKGVRPAIPVLPDEVFAAILTLLKNTCMFMERAPFAFSQLKENGIRDVLLANLNAVFQGKGSGEAFNRRGKTDILVPYDDGAVFVAECKLWSGPSTVDASTAQVLSYLRWRDSWAVVLIFSTNRGFGEVLSGHRTAVERLGSLVGNVASNDPAHLVSRHRLPGDPTSTVMVHHIIVDLSAPGDSQ